jgi:hypothetical protein
MLMGTYIDSKVITITSQSATQKRNGTYLSNVLYEMGAFLKDEHDIIHRQITLQSAQIPYSFYVINYTNNQFKYRLGSGTIFTTSIPVGNYTGNSLITALKAALESNSITLTITLSSINGLLTFSHATTNFTFYNVTYSILQTLGFAENTNYTSASLTLTCPFPLNLLGIKVLQVRSTVLSMLNYSSVSGGITTLLGTIPVNATPFGMIEYTDKGQNKVTFSNTTLDEIDIEILDGETGNFINFNNQDWTMTFCIYLTRLIEPPAPKLNYFKGLPFDAIQPNSTEPIPEPIKQDIKAKGETIAVPENKDLQELNFLAE